MSGFDPDHDASSEFRADLERRLEADAAAIRDQAQAAKRRMEDKVVALHGREHGEPDESASAENEVEDEGGYAFVYENEEENKDKPE